ncbi:hypothetical protein [Niallia circulans]|uniref:hypothetical protein n=1 Tax=Niallia circulans TaxID=1397 RepID=UPI0026EF5314|nr:hypothetical protein [Niallia circulans]
MKHFTLKLLENLSSAVGSFFYVFVVVFEAVFSFFEGLSLWCAVRASKAQLKSSGIRVQYVKRMKRHS